jgi:hypothetical protein
MSQSRDEFDKAVQESVHNSMQSLRRPRTTTNLGNFFGALFVFFWASSLTNQLGYQPFRGTGIIVFIGLLVGIGAALIFFDSLLGRSGINRSTRSAIWFSAVIGPYISILAMNNWGENVLSHMAGFAGTALAFWASYLLDKFLVPKSQPVEGAGSVK